MIIDVDEFNAQVNAIIDTGKVEETIEFLNNLGEDKDIIIPMAFLRLYDQMYEEAENKRDYLKMINQLKREMLARELSNNGLLGLMLQR